MSLRRKKTNDENWTKPGGDNISLFWFHQHVEEGDDMELYICAQLSRKSLHSVVLILKLFPKPLRKIKTDRENKKTWISRAARSSGWCDTEERRPRETREERLPWPEDHHQQPPHHPHPHPHIYAISFIWKQEQLIIFVLPSSPRAPGSPCLLSDRLYDLLNIINIFIDT